MNKRKIGFILCIIGFLLLTLRGILFITGDTRLSFLPIGIALIVYGAILIKRNKKYNQDI